MYRAFEGSHRRKRLTMTPSARLYALGAIPCVTMLVFARAANSVGGTAYLITLAIAAITYLVVVREFARNPRYPCRVVYVCLLIGIAWQIPFFLVNLRDQANADRLPR